VTVVLDAGRIEQLRQLADDDLSEILTETARDLNRLIGVAGAAVAGADFNAAFQAAHSGSNLALIVGADELVAAFRTLASSALSRNRVRAKKAVAEVGAVWPATQLAIERLPLEDTR